MPPRKTPLRAATAKDVADLEAPAVELKSIRPDLAEAIDAVRERTGKDAAQPKAKVEAEAKRQQQVVAAARSETVASVVQGIAALRLDVSAALDGLGARLTQQAEKLAQIEDAIAIESKRLSDLHDIELTADALAVLTDKQAEAEAGFTARVQEALDAARETIAAERADWQAEQERQRAELATEIGAGKATWHKEQRDHDDAVRERDARLDRDRKRQQEEHDYAWQLRKKRDEDAYQAQQQAQKQALAQEREAHDKALAERDAACKSRETAVTAREQELADLRSQLDAAAQRLEAAVQEARAAGRKEAESEAKVKAELKDREMAGERELAKLRVQTLEAKVKDQGAIVDDLQKQLAAAASKVEAIAVKAIESASGRSALQAVNEIALEQARTGRQG